MTEYHEDDLDGRKANDDKLNSKTLDEKKGMIKDYIEYAGIDAFIDEIEDVKFKVGIHPDTFAPVIDTKVSFSWDIEPVAGAATKRTLSSIGTKNENDQ